MTFLSILFDVFLFLLNIPVVFLVYFLVTRPLVRWLKIRGLFCAETLAVCVWGLSLILLYVQGYQYYDQQCKALPPALMNFIGNVSSYYDTQIDSTHPEDLLNRIKPYFANGRPEYVEGPSLYSLDRVKAKPQGMSEKLPYVRYHLDENGQIIAEAELFRDSAYGYKRSIYVRDEVKNDVREVYRVSDGLPLIQRKVLRYKGGLLWWLEPAFLRAECPSTAEQKARMFPEFDELLAFGLRSAIVEPKSE